MLTRKAPILIFGAGTGARRARTCVSHRYRVVAYVDNDPGKQGTTFLGRPVIGPQDLPHDGDVPIHIASMYGDQIYRQLTVELGIEPRRVSLVRRAILEGAYEVSPRTYVVLAALAVILVGVLAGAGYALSTLLIVR